MSVRALLLSLLAFALPSYAQQYQERVDVDVVLVDVTVTDSRGNQILGLAPDDFIVKENGVPQAIESVDYFTNRTLLTSPEEKAAFKVERVREERYLILFFDEDMREDGQNRLRRAQRDAIEFVRERMKPQDRVAVAGYDARLLVYADFTSDRKILEKALAEVPKFSQGLTRVPEYAGDVSIMRNLEIDAMVKQTGRVYDAIRMLAEAVRPIQARKVLALFSGGIGEPSSFNARIPENEEVYYQPMLRALNASNVTVHAIALLEDRTFSAREQTLGRLASETGGQYYTNVVNFAGPLSRIEKESSGYYLLTYRIRKPEGEHGYQKIDVSLKNPEFRVRARDGYVY
ncbi:MAG TPA: VWA domain-containing protein [Thermoanaerobaculia bacterium]